MNPITLKNLSLTRSATRNEIARCKADAENFSTQGLHASALVMLKRARLLQRALDNLPTT